MPGRKKDVELGTILAQLNRDPRFMSPGMKSAIAATGNAPPTAAQTKAWDTSMGRSLAPQKASAGGQQPRAYSLYGRANAYGGERQGQEFKTFVKRSDDGEVYRYHQYVTPSGKRRVFRVGGPMKAS